MVFFFRFDLSDLQTICPSYNSIMVIRLLWLRENNVDTWEMIDLLMDHREDKNYEVSKNDEKVVKFIRQYCRSSSIKVT